MTPPSVAMRGTAANTGAIREPQPAAFRLLLWHFQPLAPPEAFDSVVIQGMARVETVAPGASSRVDFAQVGAKAERNA